MIIYIASYPRSGNSWLRNIIGLNWRYLTTSGYPDNWDDLKKKSPPKYKLNEDPTTSFGKGILPANSLANYLNPLTQERRFYLKPGCLSWFNEATRKFLAAEKELFFVKTHEKPYDIYYSGEKVLQIIRNPLAVISSYYTFSQDFDNSARFLTDLIAGDVLFGSWSDYHQKWGEAAYSLGNSYLSISYEDLHSDEIAIGNQIGEFLNFTDSATAQRYYESCHERNPKRYPTGIIDGWKSHLSLEHMQMIWLLHGDVAKKYGYDMMANNASLCNDSVEMTESSRDLIAEYFRELDLQGIRSQLQETINHVGELETQLHQVRSQLREATTLKGMARQASQKLRKKFFSP
jgi:hypothetical protein